MSEDISTGAILEALNDKSDRDLQNTSLSDMEDYVIERGGGNNLWYRKWKSGWLEQGGVSVLSEANNATLNFLKPFADTSYIFMDTKNFINGTSAYDILVYDKTVNSVVLYCYQGTLNLGSINWRAEGQGA